MSRSRYLRLTTITLGLLVTTQPMHAAFMKIMHRCVDIAFIPLTAGKQHVREGREPRAATQYASLPSVTEGTTTQPVKPSWLTEDEVRAQQAMWAALVSMQSFSYAGTVLARLYGHHVNNVNDSEPVAEETSEQEALSELATASLGISSERLRYLFENVCADKIERNDLACRLADEGFEKDCLTDVDQEVAALIFMHAAHKPVLRKRLFKAGYDFKIVEYRGFWITKLRLFKKG